MALRVPGSMAFMMTVLIAATAWVVGASDLRAAEDDDPAFLSFSVGYFDANERDEDAVDLRFEYRHDERLWIFKPWFGIEATSDLSVWGGGGVLIDLYFGRRFVVTPSFGAGGYIKGNGKDLGSAIEFRSQIEAAYRFDDRSRLGVALSHISNASIGSDNPGVEIVSLYYHMPLDGLFD